MPVTMYASFSDASLAERAAGALLDHGAHNEDISLVASNAYGQARTAAAAAAPLAPDIVAPSAAAPLGSLPAAAALDPATGVAPPPAVPPAGISPGIPTAVMPPAVAPANPAIGPVVPVPDPLAFAPLAAVPPAPPLTASPLAAAPVVDTGGNTVIYADDPLGDRIAQAGDAAAAAAVTSGATGAEAVREAALARRAAESQAAAAVAGEGITVGTLPTAAYLPPVDHDAAVATQHDPELAAKGGITTTTAADAAAGAAKGAGIGLVTGILASLAAILVPGFGLVIGGGALAAAIGAMAATTAAGAIAGGVTGYLQDQGVPEDAARSYQSAIEHGGAVLAVRLPSGTVDTADAELVFSKYGAVDVRMV